MLCAFRDRHTPLWVPMLRILLFCILALLTIVLAQPARADTVTVTNTLDNGVGSLRQAVSDAVPGDVVLFDTAVFSVPLTVLLNGQIVISKSLMIDGIASGSITPTITNNVHPGRAMWVTSTVTVELRHLIFSRNGGFSFTFDRGGAILNDGKLTITGCSLTENDMYVGGALSNSGVLTIANSTISGNFTAIRAGAIYNNGTLTIIASAIVNNQDVGGDGGGIYNDGTATLIQSSVNSNIGRDSGSSGDGGGIKNIGNLNVISSTVSANSSDIGGGIANWGTLNMVGGLIGYNSASGRTGHGGGIANYGTLSVTDTYFIGNSAQGTYANSVGGGIANFGTLVLHNSALTGNYTHIGSYAHAYGAGLYNEGTSIVVNTTLYMNTSSLGNNPETTMSAVGGGMFNQGRLQLINGTIYSNTADTIADQIYNGWVDGRFEITNTIVGGSLLHASCVYEHALIDFGHNLDDGASCGFTATGSLTNTNPLLGPLQANGVAEHAMPTLALLHSSPAIDAGDDVACPLTDARGFPRPMGDHCDIGAYEAFGLWWFMPVVGR